MSDSFQSGRHPDADQLSAFAEQALPVHEREATLAHLAVCAECRAVVALSLPAEQLPKATQKPARRMWFRGWHLAWPAAAAVAALVLVLVFVRQARVARSGSGQREEMAVAPPPAPIAPQALPQKQAPGPLHANPQPRPGSSARQAMQSDAAAPKTLNQAARPALSAPRMQPPSAGMGTGSRSAIPKDLLHEPPAMAYGRAPQTPPPEAKALDRAYAPAATTMNELAAKPRRDRVQSAFAEANSAITANEASNRVMLQSRSTVRPLPSGLPVLSVARHERKMLAIDSAHSLFLSEDAGAHWRDIAVPWKARAVTVSLISFPTRNITNTGSGPGAMSGLSAGASVKKLPNPGGEASIAGTVTDQTGAAIPGAPVVVSRASDHTSRTVTTDRNGDYSVAGLAPGRYDLEVRAPGFETAHLSAVDVSQKATAIANLKLLVGTASETVTVSGSAAEKIPLETQGQTTAPAAAAPPEANSEPRIFEIRTDDGSRWTSPDGVTWNRE